MVVTIVSREMVQAKNCKDDELHKRIELTPYDLRPLQGDPMEWGLLFLKPRPSDHHHHQTHKSGTTFIQHLKNSLSSTLDFFYALAGRLVTVEHDDDDNKIKAISFFIDCNNQGAQFVHAVADHVTVADILEPIFVPSILHSFFPLNGIKNYEGVANPLLGIQVTELADGFFVGCSINHSVADGSSFWNFFNSWSEISRQLGPDEPEEEDHRRHIIISKPPVFDRSLFGTNFPIRMPFSLKDFELGPSSFPPPPSSIAFERRVFHFSKTKIADLKARARANIANYGNTIVTISSLQSLLDHVWRSMLRNRGVVELEGEETTSLFFAVGTRSRFQMPLPEEYFGNAIDLRAVTLSVGEVLNDGYAALQINKVVASHTPDEVAIRLESWIQNPTLFAPGGIPANPFLVVGSPRVDVYGNDFGWGKPVAVRSRPLNQIGGMITVFPGVEEGSIDIEICSSPESLENLGNDSDFK